MIQPEELINFILSIVFISYLLYLIRVQSRSIKTFWFLGILMIFISQIFTILEGYMYPDLFNLIEHITTCLASIFILVSVYKKELFWSR
ncbi:MAG: hypothetical protein CMB80_10560 [Flammeovirgaceae bacterium]|nr:hypothetical protein [Flammeovirgaceae bacterium]HCX22798.1 hypothetical protein [Cytophagales bacterium]